MDIITNKFSVEHFIDEVESMPAIWDLNSKEYSNKEFKRNAWEKLVLMYSNDDDSPEKKRNLEMQLQKKWKNLRDVYIRGMKKLKSGKSGSDGYVCAHFQRLSFLHPTIPNSNNINNIKIKTEQCITPTKADKRLLSNLNSPNESSPPKKYKKFSFAEAQVSSSESRITVEQKEDEDRLFCLSLLNEIKKVPAEKRLKLKIDIYKLIEKNQSSSLVLQLSNESQSSLWEEHSQSPVIPNIARSSRNVLQTHEIDPSYCNFTFVEDIDQFHEDD